MLIRIGLVICVLAALTNYNNGPLLFCLSLATVVIGLSSSIVGSYLVARPEIQKYRQTVKKMEQDGATDDEIKEYMDNSGEHVKKGAAPLAYYLLTLSSIVAGVLLFIIGLVVRL